MIEQLEREINALQFKRDIATAGSETMDEIRRLAAPFNDQIAALHARIDAHIEQEKRNKK